MENASNPIFGAYKYPVVQYLLYKAIITHSRLPHPMYLAHYEKILRILNFGARSSDEKVSNQIPNILHI